MRPTPSPTGSSGSRSMSPAVGQQSLPMPPRPSSNHSQTSATQAPNTNNSNQSNQPQTIDPAVTPPARPPTAPTTPTPTGMAAQGSYQTPPPQPPHMHGYKMGPSPGQGPGPGPQNMPPYPPQSQQYSQGNYSPRPQYPSSYGPAPGAGQPPQSNNMPLGPGQYPGRPMPNHVAPHSQFPPYQQNWGPPAPQSGMNHVQGKNAPPAPPPGSSPRPLNHLKQHLLHKGGYGGAPSPTPPQGYGNGPGMHPPMGPPHHMGPPHGPASMGGPGGMGGPNSMGPGGQMGPGNMVPSNMVPSNMGPNSMGPASMGPGNMGPPTSAPHNTPIGVAGGPNSHSDVSMPPDGPQDNGVSSSGSSSNSSIHPVTSIVTTGPDGAPMDEASQQSTLSNASAASGDDPQCSTPKSRKNESYNQSHLAPPSASPGAHAQHEDFEMASPTSWPRTPASPVFNSHGPAEPVHRTSKKSDSLCKLYDMDENPERRGWLDKLLGFMEERRTPISACPTISKQPLDLYRLYMLVKERGGFVEVCKVTKSKTWKDIAGLLGIGASSSAAYTLRKHYTKNLLAFECHFDRGGVDPLPIIQQVEAGSKKKTTKAASVPSPETNFKGSSNSQDSFPPPGSTPTSMDGYGGYPSGYPPGAGPGYNEPPPSMQRPPSQSNSQSPHSGSAPPASGDNISVSNPFDDPVVGGPPRAPYQQGGAPYPLPTVSRPQGAPYPGQQGYAGYGGPEQYGPPQPPGQYPPSQGQFPPPNRTMYPPYGPDGDANAPPVSGAPPTPGDPYRGYGGAPPGSYPPPPPRPYTQQPQPPPGSGGAGGTVGGTGVTPPTSSVGGVSAVAGVTTPGAPPQPPSTVSAGGTGAPGPYPPPPQQFEYRPDQSPQPRRHPDFTKEPQPYPPSPYGQRPQVYGGWPNNAGGGPPGGPGQYNRGQYTPQPGPQQWNSEQRPSGPPGPPGSQPPGPGQWGQHRYPPQGPQPQYPPNQQNAPPQWPNIGQSPSSGGPPGAGGPTTPMRPPHRGSGGKPFSMQPPQLGGPGGPPTANNINNMPGNKMTQAQFTQAGGPPAKRDITFPPDSVESTTPVLYRRKRIGRTELGTTDPWRVFMCLQSGLLSESTWALDVINILLFDDTAVQYFGLAHMPRLLTLLLDHFQKSLADMFDPDGDDKHGYGWSCSLTNNHNQTAKQRHRQQENSHLTNNHNHHHHNHLHITSDQADQYDKPPVDLGQVTEPPNPDDRVLVLATTTNYTLSSRKGIPIKIKEAEDDIFVLETERFWDIESNREYQLGSRVGGDPWTYGHTHPHPHDHIIDTFKAEIVNIPFARYIKSDSKKAMKLCADVTIKTEPTEMKAEPISSAIDEDSSKTGDKQSVISFKDEQSIDGATTTTTTDGAINSGVSSDEDSMSTTTVAAGNSNSKHGPSQLMDSDCREVDMELERIPNGPQSMDVDDTTDDDCRSTSQRSSHSTAKKFDFRTTVHDPAGTLKRKRITDYEDECYARDEASLCLTNESQDTLARRCICISNILRNLTFVPGNESIFANSETFLAILGKILLLHHDHPVRTQQIRNYDREDEPDFTDSCSSLQGETEWWWEYLMQLRENMMVAVANIAGHMQLSKYDELITRPVLDGLLHWAVCPAAHGQDPFPSCAPNASLSPQRLSLEALCKLCVTDANVDLVIATPPFTRLEKLCSVLTRHLCRNEDQVLREFSVNLLHYLAAADSAMARTVAMQSPCISYLVAFIEQAEQTALGVANQHGINYLRENPDSMGTSLDMLRRTAGTLLHLARHPDNRPLFLQQEQRLLGLVMSHILDQQVALIISRVLFQVSRGSGPMTMAELKQQSKMLAAAAASAPAVANGLMLGGGVPSPSAAIVTAAAPLAAPTATLATTTSVMPCITTSAAVIGGNSGAAAVVLNTSGPSPPSSSASTTSSTMSSPSTLSSSSSSSSSVAPSPPQIPIPTANNTTTAAPTATAVIASS